jgi:hypothetical protein
MVSRGASVNEKWCWFTFGAAAGDAVGMIPVGPIAKMVAKPYYTCGWSYR